MNSKKILVVCAKKTRYCGCLPVEKERKQQPYPNGYWIIQFYLVKNNSDHMYNTTY